MVLREYLSNSRKSLVDRLDDISYLKTQSTYRCNELDRSIKFNFQIENFDYFYDFAL